MGQSQSSSSGTPAEPEQPLKRDYYELLSVERTATDDEIKKAYRKKALELHPDRNYGNEEGATRLFAEIQAAYEVLADPQERAWYDSHRDVLLRGDTVGGDGGLAGADNFAYGGKMTSAEDVLKLMMRFNNKVQFTDSPSGFYGGLREFFELLAKEEEIAAQWEDEEGIDYPPFGSKEDDYEDIVRPFYAVWNGFATKKSYAWKDKWRLSDAPERRIRRLMEKENGKLRDEAIFEFNDAVRSLVAFVRKRDPRVQNNQKSEAERKKALKDLAAAQAARARTQREAEIESFSLPEWARSREQDKDEFEGGFSSDEQEEQHEYECVVCSKTFKSEKQYQAHEKSKKHIKLLKDLKRDMKKQGKELNLEDESTHDDIRPAEDHEEIHENQSSHKSSPSLVEDGGSEEEIEGEEVPTSLPQRTATKQPPSTELLTTSEENSDYAPRARVERRIAAADDDDSDSEPDDLSNLTSDLKSSNISTSQIDTPSSTISESETDMSAQAKPGKAKQKRAKKAAAVAATNGSATASDDQFKCQVCQGVFNSNTKLFNHIKEKNHYALKTQVAGGAKSKGGKGKKR